MLGFLWCALMYSCSKAAAEEQCVSTLQCSCECMQMVISLQVQLRAEEIVLLGAMFLTPQDSPEKSSNF